MLSKSEKRLILTLRRRRKRSKQQLVLVEGIRTVGEALATNIEIAFCVQSPKLLATANGEKLARKLEEDLGDVRNVSDNEIETVSDTANSQGVLLVCQEPLMELSSFTVESGTTLLLIDGVQDPGNLGTLVRAARAFNISAVIGLEGTADFWSSKAIRASAGAIFYSQVFREPWDCVASWLENNPTTALLTANTQGTDIADFHVEAPWALVVGNENKGIRKSILEISKKLAIPMSTDVESLNAGVAGSTLLYLLSSRSDG